MKTKSFTSLEASFLSAFNKGYNTVQTLKEQVPYNEKTLNNVIENLISRNVIKFDAKQNIYVYDSPVSGEVVILEGNIMLPVSIIETRTKIIISRGLSYEFEKDFDVRRIIWNVKLPNNKNTTLIDLIQSSVVKTKKSKNVQLPEYSHLVGKIIPWSQNLKLRILIFGDDTIDVDMLFIERLTIDGDEMYKEFKDFHVKSEIKTQDLLDQLAIPAEERNFGDIKINRMFNLSDFIFTNNCIPYQFDNHSINFIKITGIRKGLELTYYRLNNDGKLDKLDMELFDNVNDGYTRLSECFEKYAQTILAKNDILIEMSE